MHPRKWFLGWKKSREDEERLLPYTRFGEDEPMSKEEWLEGAHDPIPTTNPIPAQEEEQGKTLPYLRVATLVPETPPRHENEEEYSALAMELLQAICWDVRLVAGSSPDRLRGTINKITS